MPDPERRKKPTAPEANVESVIDVWTVPTATVRVVPLAAACIWKETLAVGLLMDTVFRTVSTPLTTFEIFRKLDPPVVR